MSLSLLLLSLFVPSSLSFSSLFATLSAGGAPFSGVATSCFFCCSTEAVSHVDAAAAATTGGVPSAGVAPVVVLAGSSDNWTAGVSPTPVSAPCTGEAPCARSAASFIFCCSAVTIAVVVACLSRCKVSFFLSESVCSESDPVCSQSFNSVSILRVGFFTIASPSEEDVEKSLPYCELPLWIALATGYRIFST